MQKQKQIQKLKNLIYWSLFLVIAFTLFGMTIGIIEAYEQGNNNWNINTRGNKQIERSDRINGIKHTTAKNKGKEDENKVEKHIDSLCSLDAVICPNEKQGTIREVTAYSEIDSCHTGKSCLMANRKKAHIGAVACPRNIELGTKVKIGDLGVFTCEDRTALWVDGRFDIFMGFGTSSYEKAKDFGKRQLAVTIL